MTRDPTGGSVVHDGCADWSAALDEPLGGTNVLTSAWLLIEEPGAWGEHGLPESAIDAAVAAVLERRASAAGVRIQLIRRSDRFVGDRRRVVFVSSRPGATWMASLTCDCDYAELTDLDLAHLAARASLPDSHDWEPVDGPIFLVCTHAKRDPCCATYGRAAAAALAVTRPDRSWETSHTGGHRFAPNLLCLPDGLAFGRLTPEGVNEAAEAYERGSIVPAGYRGRSAHDRFVQAADVAVRRRLGAVSVDAVRLDRVDGDGDERVVHLSTPAGEAQVAVVSRPTGTERLIGCHKDTPTDPGEHVVTRLTFRTHG